MNGTSAAWRNTAGNWRMTYGPEAHYLGESQKQRCPSEPTRQTRHRTGERVHFTGWVRVRDLKKPQRAAIEAVARHFSATWEEGSSSSDAYLTVAGKRVAVDLTTLKRRGTARGNPAKPRLRFDKSATKLIERLQASLGETVPEGMTVVLTITAPIRVRSKTAASLEDKIQTLLRRRSPGRDDKDTIHGNRVQIRLLRHQSARAPRMIAFVHNPDSDARLLLNMTQELLELISAEAGRRAPRRAGDRWLVVRSAKGTSCLEAYRVIHSQLRVATGFKKILIVFGDGRVGTLVP
jgi:hypothetical protein